MSLNINSFLCEILMLDKITPAWTIIGKLGHKVDSILYIHTLYIYMGVYWRILTWIYMCIKVCTDNCPLLTWIIGVTVARLTGHCPFWDFPP